jgi:hypothetical protein
MNLKAYHINSKNLTMNSKRRLIIVATSVLMGTFLAYLLVKSRLGTLKPNDWMQLGFNFIFAVAIVIGIGFLFIKTRDKNPKE